MVSVIFVSLISFISDIDPCLCYDGFLGTVLLFLVALNQTTQQYSTCVVYRTFKQYRVAEICGFIPSVCCD